MLASTVLQNGYYGDYPDVIPRRKADIVRGVVLVLVLALHIGVAETYQKWVTRDAITRQAIADQQGP